MTSGVTAASKFTANAMKNTAGNVRARVVVKARAEAKGG